MGHEEAALTFKTRKALALFVYLVVEGGQQSREKLATLFWPDSDRPHARAMLRYTLTGIRRALSDSADAPHLWSRATRCASTTRSGLELDLDVLRTARAQVRTGTLSELRRVAACCRDAFLEGFSLPDAPDFDDWSSLQREARLRTMELVFDRLSQLEAESGTPTKRSARCDGGSRSIR